MNDLFEKVVIDYASGTRKLEVDTPVRRHTIKKVYRREYSYAMNNLQKQFPPETSVEAPAKIIMNEIKELCSLKDKSVFRNKDQGIRDFKWESLWVELASKAPTLLQLYRQLFRGASKPLICFAISMIIKWRSSKMGIVQKVISAVMYGNGASKQVSVCDIKYYYITIWFLFLYSCTTVCNL